MVIEGNPILYGNAIGGIKKNETVEGNDDIWD